jgi:hypothetical protein
MGNPGISYAERERLAALPEPVREPEHVLEAGDKPTANPRCACCGQHLRDLVKRLNPRRCEP